jgi:hypothetical protein
MPASNPSETIKLSEIKPNPNNPRVIKDDKFHKLVKSIQDFPKMLELRPMVVNEDNILLGGNMRLKALQHLKYTEIPVTWVRKAEDLTEDEQRQFIVKDNVGFGEWDWELLANEWNSEELSEWGLEVPNFGSDVDYSEKNKEIDTDDFDDKMIIKLEFTESDYHLVKDKLSKIASTPEQAIFTLLGLNNE